LFQWLEDVFDEAKKLFIRPEAEENADDDDEDEDVPILLPQTPKVKSARAERMMKKTRFLI
jgi:hypothetical protein